MEEKMDAMLEKVEPARRGFIKKVAIGAAYAVPVMASFSLDSVRSKALAQASYTTPPTPSPTNPPATQTPPRVSRLELVGSEAGIQVVRVVFTQPMDTSLDSNASPDSRAANGICYDREWFIPSENNAQASASPPAGAWTWENTKAQRLTISGGCSVGNSVTIRYGMMPDPNDCIDFRGANGLTLAPFEGSIGLGCQIPT